MAMYSLNLMRIALELARTTKSTRTSRRNSSSTSSTSSKHEQHRARKGIWPVGRRDHFYYDVLNLPDGRMVPLKVRSLVGLSPLFAVEVLESSLLDEVPQFKERLEWF
jgi:hypothetical protein